MSLFFYLFALAINLWHRKFVTTDVTAVFVNNQHDIKQRGQDFDKKTVFEGVHSEEVDRRISWEKLDKAWLISCSKSCRTQAQLTGGQAVADLAVPTLKKKAKLLQKFPQSATDFVLPIVRWSDREHLFIRQENKVSGILQELLKQKLSMLHASSAVLSVSSCARRLLKHFRCKSYK